jgi:hypothetical protein
LAKALDFLKDTFDVVCGLQQSIAQLAANFRRDFPQGRLALICRERLGEVRQVYWGYRDGEEIRYLGKAFRGEWVERYSPMYADRIVDIRAYESRRNILHRRLIRLVGILTSAAKSAAMKRRLLEEA